MSNNNKIKYKINPNYYKSKKNVISGINVISVHSVVFKGLKEEADKIKFDDYIKVDSIKTNNDVIEGRIYKKDEKLFSYEDICNLISEHSMLKVAFLFTTHPFWKGADINDKRFVPCIAFSDSGVPVVNHYRVLRMEQYPMQDAFDKIDILAKNERVFRINSESNTFKLKYLFPFKYEWEKYRYCYLDENNTLREIKKTYTRQIRPVTNNNDKSVTYRNFLRKYKIAMENEFYIEAMIIVYAAIEDRLISMLKHLSIINKEMKCVISKEDLYYIMNFAGMYEKNFDRFNYPKMYNISSKIDIFKSLLIWSRDVDGDYKDNEYLTKLKSKVEKLDIQECLDVLEYIEWWKDYRNEVIHALMNKNNNEVHEEIADMVEEGNSYFRILDSNVKKIR